MKKIKKKICIIGQSGFVGNTIYNYFLNKNYEIEKINSQTKKLPNITFDTIINCAGNSKKYFAEFHPEIDINKNISPFFKILQLKTKNFIHISSIDAIKNKKNNYTKSKILAETCTRLYFPRANILRLGGLIGPNLTKNTVYDITNNKNLFVSFDSSYNYISTQEIAKIIEKIIKLNIWGKIINIASSKPITVNEIIKEAQKKSIFFTKLEGKTKETYKKIKITELNKFFKVKTSYYYIKKYLNNFKKY